MEKACPNSISILPSQPLRKRAAKVSAISTDDEQNIGYKMVRDMKKHDSDERDEEDKKSIQEGTDNFFEAIEGIIHTKQMPLFSRLSRVPYT